MNNRKEYKPHSRMSNRFMHSHSGDLLLNQTAAGYNDPGVNARIGIMYPQSRRKEYFFD